MPHNYHTSAAIVFLVVLPAALAAARNEVEIPWQQTFIAANAAYQGGKYAEAADLYASAINKEEAAGIKDVRLARSLYEFGIVRGLQGRCAEASRLLERGIRILGATSSPEASQLSTVWLGLSAVYTCQHQYSKAEHATYTALDLEQNSPMPQNDRLALILSYLGGTYSQEGKYSEATEALERARAILDQNPGAYSHQSALLLNNLGALEERMGRYSEAEATLSRGLAFTEGAADPDGAIAADRVALLSNLACLEYERKHYHEAAARLKEAVSLLDKGARISLDEAVMTLHSYAVCLRKIGDKRHAREFESRVSDMKRELPPEHGLVVDVTQLARGK